MTLFRALGTLISILLLVILTGTCWISVNNSRRFLEAQLATHAQDTATFVGLTISSVVKQDYLTAAESIVDSIFDHGYYQRIRMLDIKGDLVIDRHRRLSIKDVPAWFVGRIAFDTPAGSALIMSGWQQAGQVVVESHPGHAYAELWSNFTGIACWFAGIYLAGMFLLLGLLHIILDNLRAVEKMAGRISQKEFPVLDKLPWSRELKSVARAMNQMSRRLKTSFEEQTVFIETLSDRAYRDPVTQIANRSAFEPRLKHLLQSPDEFSVGALYILHIDDFQSYNQKHGHAAGDRVLRQAARTIDEECRRTGRDFLLARLTGAQFGILLESCQEDDLDCFADTLIDSLARPDRYLQEIPPFSVHCGVAVYTGSETMSGLLAQADMALRTAKDLGGNAWHRMEKTTRSRKTVFAADDLRVLLKKRLEKGDISLNLAPVFSIPEMTVMHSEVLVRVADDQGRLLPAQLFIQLAEEMAIVSELDRLVIEAVLEKMKKASALQERYAVNLSTRSLKNPAFVSWLCNVLKKSPGRSRHLSFECREFDLTADLAAMKAPIDQIAASGGKIGIDRFGLGSRPFGYLLHLKPEYLKMDGSYLTNIENNNENQFFIRSTATIAHGLGVKMVTTHVEKMEDVALLKRLGVDAAQGHALDRSHATTRHY